MTDAGRRIRRTQIILGLALFASYAYFYQAGGWNQNSRFALVRAIIERHTLQIDAYSAHTGDRALFNGHYYSDKSPGTALLGVVPAVFAREVDHVVHVDPEGFPGLAWTSYAATVATCGVFTLVAALLVFSLSVEWGYSRNAALFAATAYGIAMPAWCFATVFVEHAIVAGALMLAFAAAVRAAPVAPRPVAGSPEAAAQSPKPVRIRSLFFVGFWVGLAVVSELQAAIPGALVVLLAFFRVRRADPRALQGAFGAIAAGGSIFALVLFSYNALAFGSPFHIGYASEEGFDDLRTIGFYGIAYPQLWRMREILVGSYRGLLPLAPLVALTPIGLFLIGRRRGLTGPAITAAAIVLFYFLLNASYYYWEGGWFYSPRHVSATLPFLALGLAPLWDRWRRWGRVLLTTGWIWGAALTLIAVSTTPQPPSDLQSPVTQLLWPAFRDGDLSINTQSMVHYVPAGPLRNNPDQHASWNLGQLAGLHGHASLAPLAGVWLAAGAALLL